MEYALNVHRVEVDNFEGIFKGDWKAVLVPPSIKLATDIKNPLRKYY